MADTPWPHMHEYLVNMGSTSAASGGFELVTRADVNLEGATVMLWTEQKDKGPREPDVTSPSESLTNEPPPMKRYKGSLSVKSNRTAWNCPDGIDVDTWIAGISTEEMPGFTMVRFLYSPKECWSERELWVTSTTTAGDCKAWLSNHVAMHHTDTFLVGLTSQKKLEWQRRILEASPENWAPTEDRVLMPSNARLDVFMEF